MKNKSAIFPVLFAVLFLSILFSCKKEAIKTAPTVTISAVTNITATSASSGGEITADGGATITVRGVCWSTNQSPTTSDSKTSNGSGTGSFTSSITGLTPGATYNIKAYATNSVGTGYSSQSTFITLALAPILTTTVVSAITSTTATSGGNITNNGGSAVTARGVCWSTSQNPTIADSKISSGTGSGSFTSAITGLTPGATYYVRAYATNSIGTGYGNQVTATTIALLPTITTTPLSGITATTATSGGNITSDGGATVTARGVCWSTSQNPTIANSKTIDGTGVGSFASNLTTLSVNTTYYVRAYATNSAGTAYGAEFNFKTIPVLSFVTNTPINITYKSVELGGNITSEGISAVTERGICYSKSQNPTTSNNKLALGSGMGNFTSQITDLITNTTYYVRSYAIDSQGTTYGNELNFTTKIVSIGDSYQGGIVAYILKSSDSGYISGQTHGLIAAPNDQGPKKWYPGSFASIIITGATGLTIGTGNANTIAIVTQQGVGDYAAKSCYDLILNGYDDWYLPSRDELNALRENRILIGGFGLTYSYYCWSSSESTDLKDSAWGQMFDIGLKDIRIKQGSYYFRAIRNF